MHTFTSRTHGECMRGSARRRDSAAVGLLTASTRVLTQAAPSLTVPPSPSTNGRSMLYRYQLPLRSFSSASLCRKASSLPLPLHIKPNAARHPITECCCASLFSSQVLSALPPSTSRLVPPFGCLYVLSALTPPSYCL
uniref:Uncharacterized protein n=1 Tax=Leishmania guyanensis TaxID=5670 RepID=A0A1E1IRP5_LEIGU|nr:hypothetical protein, conserved [Leishmania guyanensis]